MLEEDDGLGFADFLASVQEEEKDGIKLSNFGFLNGKIYATVNGYGLALYDGENLELETNAYVDRRELESLLDEEFESCIRHPFVETLENLNSCCEHDETVGVLITDDYEFLQVQEGDSQGWTLVYNKDKKIVAYMNWQACGCRVETIDDEFYRYLRERTEKGTVYAGLDDLEKVRDRDLKYFWETVDEILRLWDSGKRGKDYTHYFEFSEKAWLAWRSELMNDLSCNVICDERYYKSKDPIGFALKEARSMAKYNPECLYRGKKLTRRLIRDLLKDAEASVNGD